MKNKVSYFKHGLFGKRSSAKRYSFQAWEAVTHPSQHLMPDIPTDAQQMESWIGDCLPPEILYAVHIGRAAKQGWPVRGLRTPRCNKDNACHAMKYIDLCIRWNGQSNEAHSSDIYWLISQSWCTRC